MTEEMSQGCLQPSQDQLKSYLKFPSLPNKPSAILALLVKISVFVSLISSISIVGGLHTPARTLSSPEPPGPTNISHVLFCIGGSVATWHNRSGYMSTWWNPNTTRGFVWLDEHLAAEDRNISSVPYKVSSPDWTRFRFSSSKYAVRIARIVLESFQLRMPGVRWFVMGDDDTVYFTENLVSVLAKYDHNQMWYIGGASESVEQDVLHTYDMAFGGGGFAISYPLAERLAALIDGCLDRYFYFYGSDDRIWACISELGVGLTKERGFHQLDIRDSPYGILAAHPLAPLVTLHHFDALDPIFPDQDWIESLETLNLAYNVDPARTIQQSFCYDRNQNWSISVAWGYTIQLHPSLLPAKDLQTPLQTFRTWRSWSPGPFTFNTRPLSNDPCQQPVKYFLDLAEAMGNCGSITSYKVFVPKPENMCNKTEYAKAYAMQRITVTALKMDPQYWKAPRRQCCEIMDSGSRKSGTMRLRIRKCRPWETISI